MLLQAKPCAGLARDLTKLPSNLQLLEAVLGQSPQTASAVPSVMSSFIPLSSPFFPEPRSKEKEAAWLESNDGSGVIWLGLQMR